MNTEIKSAEEEIKEFYAQWCKDTKRNGGVLIGSSIKELLTSFAAQFTLAIEGYGVTVDDIVTDISWDQFSEHVDDNLDSLQYYAGRSVMVKENFVKALTPYLLKLNHLHKRLQAQQPIKSVPERVFFIDDVRKLINEYIKEEISLSKLVEVLNEKATGIPALERFKIEHP